MLISRRAYEDLLENVAHADAHVMKMKAELNRQRSLVRNYKSELDKRDADISELAKELWVAENRIAELKRKNLELEIKLTKTEDNV